ncbi:MAG: hypothetical protein N3D73_02185 [Candidatus Diapherotrites archaeon]|nr:hypothetical protein [Candidatus Diapherotrites archaeon]
MPLLKKRHNRGFLFSVIVMLFIILLMQVYEISSYNRILLEKSKAKIKALENSVKITRSISNNFYYNNPAIDNRILPFSFNIDKNIFDINVELPINKNRILTYYDLINSYEIFLEKGSNYLGYIIDINVPKNADWNGNDKKIYFTIEPICTNFFIEDENKIWLEECNEDKIKKVGVKIKIPAGLGHDFNNIQCTFQEYTGCPQEDYNTQKRDLYFYLEVDSSECEKCFLSNNIIKAHIKKEQENKVVINCLGNDCTSDRIEILLNPLIIVKQKENEILVNISLESDVNIDNFYFASYEIYSKNPMLEVETKKDK